MNIGCHLSASKGYLSMGKQALEIGADTFAFFTRNPRGGNAKKINPDDVKAFLEFAKEHNFGKLVAHAPYTLNACSADESIRQFAKNTFKSDLEIMEYTPNQYYNFHPGSHVKQGVDVGIEYISQMLNESLKKEQTTTVLLETMAGKGSEIGRTFEEIKRIIDNVELKDKLGVCFDTCHVWDAGYDIVSDFSGVLEEFDRVIGIERLKAVHINDSKNILGSHKDRHEKIGLGNIGTEAFRTILNDERMKDLPFILETPNDLTGYAEEIKLLRSLVG
ncbi:MAG: deoxyribonuclease IV [Oscillospiraceae bacterium]|nr:deoxyribonuclease IV [Oscillospiraceae bacterium]